jgi:hypothetical protein
MTATYCGLVGEVNNSASSGIGILFLSSCNVVFLSQTIDTTFQSEIIKKIAEL